MAAVVDEPVLVIASGQQAGTRWELPEGRTTLGRHSSNDLVLDDSGASRRHCAFVRGAEGCRVVDLDSHNGTFVNGEKVTERALAPGDEIRIGATVLMLALGNTPERNEGASSDGTMLVNPASSREISVSDFPVPRSAIERHDMALLLRITMMLHSFRAMEDASSESLRGKLSQNIVAVLRDTIPCDSAAVLAPSGDFQVWAMDPAGAAIDKRVPALLGGMQEPLSAPGTPAVLAAPVVVRGSNAAILYLACDGVRLRFTNEHLEALSALAMIASTAWENALAMESLRYENEVLREEVAASSEMVGHSALLDDLREKIARAARTASTVLILGESGTGKELVARAVHMGSSRSHAPFMAINCAALTESLLESELFGYEKGAFTGAYTQRKGKLEAADGGTVFLDEIGEMPLALQSKLLRVLQQRELERVGGTQKIKLDIRVVAATNRNLEEAVRKGAFRSDLFYRLNVITLRTPALRERPEDILPLAEHFARRYGADCGRRVTGVAPAARPLLQRYAWPGNVRELENAMERAVVLGSSDMVLPEDLPETIMESRPAGVPAALYEEAVQQAKREVVLRAFDQAAYDHEQAARLLGLHPNYLHRLIRALDLRETLKRAGRGGR